MIDITPLLNSLITLIAAAIAAFLIPYLKQRSGDGQRQKLLFWLEIAVKAAEEYYAGPGRGEQKADYVRQFLNEKGFQLDSKEAAALINGTVWSVINQYKETQI